MRPLKERLSEEKEGLLEAAGGRGGDVMRLEASNSEVRRRAQGV